MDKIYFSVNNWIKGKDFPDTESFSRLIKKFMPSPENDKWAKENKLCIRVGVIYMSNNFLVVAPKDWVLRECPEIIGSKFEYTEEKIDKYGMYFPTYIPENYGIEWDRSDWNE